MRIRGVAELNQALDEAIAWRKRDISNIHLLIMGTRREHEMSALRRAAVPILYSHWEGFTKQAAEFYLELVSKQNLLYNQLKTNFLAIACRSTINDASQTKNIVARTQLVDFLIYNHDHRAKLSTDRVIDTESNLNSKVLLNLLHTIGLIIDDFWQGKELLIDGSLLKHRNEIAHGKRIEVDHETYVQLHGLVLDMIEHIKTTIENAASLKSYLRN